MYLMELVSMQSFSSFHASILFGLISAVNDGCNGGTRMYVCMCVYNAAAIVPKNTHFDTIFFLLGHFFLIVLCDSYTRQLFGSAELVLSATSNQRRTN